MWASTTLCHRMASVLIRAVVLYAQPLQCVCVLLRASLIGLNGRDSGNDGGREETKQQKQHDGLEILREKESQRRRA